MNKKSTKLNFQPYLKMRFWLSLFLAIFAFIIYSNTLNNKQAVDDGSLAYNKLVMKGWGAFGEYLKIPEYPVLEREYNHNTSSVYYFYTRPVTNLCFAMEVAIFGKNNYFAAHLINVLLYSITGVFLFLLLQKLFTFYSGKKTLPIPASAGSSLVTSSKRDAGTAKDAGVAKDAAGTAKDAGTASLLGFVITLLFIAHPIHTEVVANIKSRDEILSFLFGLVMTLYFLVLSRQSFYTKASLDMPSVISNKSDTQSVRSTFQRWNVGTINIYYLISVMCFFLGIFSKENAITFIAIIPLTLYFFTDTGLKKAFLLTLPYFLIGILYIASRVVYVEIIGLERPDIMQNVVMGAGNLNEIYGTAFVILLEYLKRLFYPNPLVWDSSYAQFTLTGLTNFWALISLFTHIGLLLIAIYLTRKRRIIAYSIWFYFITFSINSNLFNISYCTLGERLLYASSLGFCIVLGFAITMRGLWQKGLGFSGLKDYKIKKSERIINYKSEIKNLNLNNLIISGIVLLVIIFGYSYKTYTRNKDWRDNLSLNLADVQNSPNSARIHHVLGIMHISRAPVERSWSMKYKRYSEAIGYFERAVEIYPKSRIDWFNLAIAYYKAGNIKKSRISFGMYLNLERDDFLYENWVRFKSSIVSQKSLVISHKMRSKDYFRLGEIYMYIYKNYDKAMQYYMKALEIDPKYSFAAYSAGRALYYEHKFEESIKRLKIAARRFPNKRNIYQAIGDNYLRMNNIDNAVMFYDKYMHSVHY